MNLTPEQINKNTLDFVARDRGLTDNLTKMGAITEVNAEAYAADRDALGAKVEAGEMTPDEAAIQLYERYKPLGGHDVKPTQEETSAQMGNIEPDRSALSRMVETDYSKYLKSGEVQVSDEDIDAFIETLSPEEQKKLRKLRESSNL